MAHANSFQQRRGASLKRVEMVDHGIGVEAVEWACRIAEAHEDDRHARGFGGPDIDRAVADHDGAGGLAAGKGDDAGQVARVGLGNGEGIAPGDRAEIAFKLKRLEEPPGEVFPLIGAHREPCPSDASASSAATAPGKGRLSLAMFVS